MDSLDRTFVRALFTNNYYKVYQAMEKYIMEILIKIFNKMKMIHFLQQDFKSVQEIIDDFGLHTQSKFFLTWSLNYLYLMGLVQRNHSKYHMDKAVAVSDINKNIQQIMEYEPTSDIFIHMMNIIEKYMEKFFTGRKRGSDILFGDVVKMNLWNKYFNNYFYGYSVLNYGIAYGVTKWYSQTEGKRMLEIGSGTSGATLMVFQMLQNNNLLNSLKTIILSDIVESLLAMGQRNIEQRFRNFQNYEQIKLDINKPFAGQGLTKDSFDIIFGSNVLHVAQDLSFSMKELYHRLNKDGILVLSETIRPFDDRPMHHEIIFNLLENYSHVKLDHDLRPYHGFLTKEFWIRNFRNAGFKNIDYIEEVDSMAELDFDIKPLHSVFIIKGQK